MKQGQADNKLLLVVLVVVLVIGAVVVSSRQKRQIGEKMSLSPTVSISESVIPQKASVNEGLELAIIKPVDGMVVSDNQLKVQGKTAPNAEVFINDRELKADSQGSFSANISLDEGQNVVVITASDEEGNYAEKELAVTYEP